jgi:hypothetical protein
MPGRLTVSIVLVVTALGAGAGLFAAGRATADDAGAARRAADAGGYLRGFGEGRAEGVEEGRALQQAQTLPAGSRPALTAAFRAGYTAGADDVFGGYDGGWSLCTPYVITLTAAPGPITYRIATRVPLGSASASTKARTSAGDRSRCTATPSSP